MANKQPERPFKVYTIKEGTVIDHIPRGRAIEILRMLKLVDSGNFVTMGSNFKSKKKGYKDIIKIEGKELTPEEVNQVALLAPKATINIIRDYKIVDKFVVELPEVFEDMVKCPNPKCITNMDPQNAKFIPTFEGKEMLLQCVYCEKLFKPEELNEYVK
ncbi:aspartate carbamoyltransferase regulatory subunit [Patescibacteria group bacterium]|nr:aspartate carbamoyltransferase regulatory subunit [Patescibacteria group bacterium]MBU1672879.1 aspartate carbamoyltransferase regulatory subunit [Patescibacteria group bacterium]MBU1963130.1 aspartate carbamoyltransferase regulatory subunit [Patescibacteria group bacterium]